MKRRKSLGDLLGSIGHKVSPRRNAKHEPSLCQLFPENAQESLTKNVCRTVPAHNIPNSDYRGDSMNATQSKTLTTWHSSEDTLPGEGGSQPTFTEALTAVSTNVCAVGKHISQNICEVMSCNEINPDSKYLQDFKLN